MNGIVAAHRQAPRHRTVALDDARGINYAADGSVIGIEIVERPRRVGVPG